MDDIKYYFWVSTTIIVTAVFIAAGDWIFSFLALIVSYVLWIAKSK